MSIIFPPWYRGGRWNIEPLLRDVFTFDANESALDSAELRVERFFASPEGRLEWIDDGHAYLLIHRRGGTLATGNTGWVDQSVVEIAAVTGNADESHALNEYVTSVLDAWEEGGTVVRSTPHKSGLSTTHMAVPGEVVGPQLIPELTRDERYVTTTWAIHADVPKGLPNYRESLGLDSE